MTRPLVAAAVLASLLAVSACVPAGGPADGGRQVELVGTQWQLRDLAGAPVAGEAWIGFEPGGQAGGNSGCNQFGGSYFRDGDDLTFSNMQATLMACVEPARMETERAFISALQATREVSGTESLLHLHDAQGNVVATLSRRA